MRRRLATILAAGTFALLTVLGTASPAAAVTTTQKLSVLSSWTQTSAASYHSWNAARLDRAPWASYNFNWSTDYCSSSPDNPLGFKFSLSCARHDFGYRNYKAVGQFSANKPRLDSAFYADLVARSNRLANVLHGRYGVRPGDIHWVAGRPIREIRQSFADPPFPGFSAFSQPSPGSYLATVFVSCSISSS